MMDELRANQDGAVVLCVYDNNWVFTAFESIY